MLKEVMLYIMANQDKYLEALAEHIRMDGIALSICLLIAIPLGYLCAKNKYAEVILLNGANLLKIIPTIAKFLILMPFLGLGERPALIALVLLSIPTVMINTMTGIRSVEPQILECARGMGMGSLRICLTVELPLASSYILNGTRMAVIEVVAGTTVAAYVGAGGLGDFIVTGLATNNSTIMYAGAITAALLSVVLDFAIHVFQRRIERKTLGIEA